jgi:uncharacterized protein
VSSKTKNSTLELIGVIHLLPLPGSPQASPMAAHQALEQAGYRAVQEAVLLEKAGFDSLIVENFLDSPFFKDQVPAETLSAMSVIVAAITQSVKIKVGVNVLRNDGLSALSIAAVTGADFIRVNVLSGAMVTDQGVIEGRAAELLRKKDALRSDTRIFADVLVKHAKPLADISLEQAIEESAGRGGADAVIVTGSGTGVAPEIDWVRQASTVAKNCGVPIYLGSGATAKNISNFAPYLSGVIVGSALRKGGKAGADLDMKRIKEFTKAVKSIRSKKR